MTEIICRDNIDAFI